MSDDRLRRRRVLRVGAALAATGSLAGCSQDGGGGTTTDATDDTPTATPTDTRTDTPTVDCSTVETTIDDHVTEDRTLPGGCTYTLTAEVKVQEGATLTVEPGATIAAEQGTSIRVTDGRLVASGTADAPISIRGTTDEQGHWDGIRVDTATANEFRHVRFAHGGNTTFKKADLAVRAEGASVTVRNCEFADSAGTGLKLDHGSTLDDFGGNRFVANAGPPLVAHPDHMGSFEGTSTFSQHPDDRSFVGISLDSTTREVTADATWPEMALPYRMAYESNDDWTVIEADVTVEPGTRFEFAQGHGLRVDEGSLTAVGDPDDPIEFVGTEGEPGHWFGVFVNSDGANEFRHVRIAHAGGTTFNESNLALGAGGESRATIRDCEFADSAGSGVQLLHGSTLDDFGGNRFVANAGPPLVAHPDYMGSFEGTSTFSQHPDDRSFVGISLDSTTRELPDDATWRDMGLPYRMAYESNDDWTVIRADVTVEPGARFEFAQGHGLRVDEGSLTAVGDPDDPIEFVGAEDEQGHWFGIEINTLGGNTISNARVSDGGGTTFTEGNVTVGAGAEASVSVAESTISDSEGWGIYIVEESSAGVDDLSFSNNKKGDIRRPDPDD